MRFTTLIFLFILLGLQNNFAQTIHRSVIGSAGRTNQIIDKKISWTIGETAVLTISNNNIEFKQGFYQNFTCNRESDSLQLVELYNATDGDNWTYSATTYSNINSPSIPIPNAGSSWDFNNPINTWHGVQLNTDGCVELLILNENGLKNELIDLNLPNLKTFDCTLNSLSGNILDFENLPNLETLYCGGNSLSGSIPDFSNLPNLQYFWCSFNELEGNIPDFSNLPNLGYFWCRNNNLSGCFPSFICDLNLFDGINNEQLPWEGEHTNFCNGDPQINAPCNDGDPNTIDDQIASDCSCLGAFSCRYGDSLALVEFYNATNGPNWTNPDLWILTEPMETWDSLEFTTDGCVRKINLKNCNLTGEIPDLNLSNLISLNISRNNLTGELPDFSGLPVLDNLDCEENDLTGEIPDFSNLDSLTRFDCGGNNFTGEIPNFSNLPLLKLIDCDNNQLTHLPNFSNLPELGTLDCDNNQITGNIPAFDMLPKLRSLDISLNEFDNVVPDLSTNCQNLRRFYFSHNELTFEDILPNLDANIDLILSNPAGDADSLRYHPQDSVYVDTMIMAFNGENLIVDLGFDEFVSSNKYDWFKDGAIYQTVFGYNKLGIPNISTDDEGVYHCEITNPNAPYLTLYSYEITVNVKCNPDNFDQPTNNCFDAPIICEGIDGFCNSLDFPNDPKPFLGCNNEELNNAEWVAFVAGSEMISIQINPSNCDNNGGNTGMQAAIYEDFCSGDIIATQCDCTDSAFELSSSSFIVGRTYYLVLNGCEGASCDYGVEVLEGSTEAIELTTPMVTGPMNVCVGDTATYMVEELVEGAAGYAFILSNAPGSATFGEFDLRSYVFSGTGMAELCVEARNGCYTSSQSCLTINIQDVISVQEELFICPGGMVECVGQVFTSPGNYEITLPSSTTCDTIVECTVTLIGISPNDLGQITQCGGDYEICGNTITQSGLYSETCESFQGCDSTVMVDLAILDPMAIIETPDVLGCQFGNSSITLNGTNSTSATASGAITQFFWDGPGIVSNPSDITIEIEEAGEYCLTVTHERNGVVCEDTQCVTVQEMPISEIVLDTSLCNGESIIIKGTTYNQSNPMGMEIFDNAASNGCDSVVNIDLDFYPPDGETIETFICKGDTYTVGGSTFFETGNYMIPFKNLNGCDSNVNLILLALDTPYIQFSESICEGESLDFGGMTYSEEGIYLIELQTMIGCDSTIELNLSVHPLEITIIDTAICKGEIFYVGDQEFSETGFYSINLLTEFDCDSLIELTLEVVDEENIMAIDDAIFLPDGQSQIQFTPIENDIYPENGDSTLTILTQPSIGQASISEKGLFEFTLSVQEFSGRDSFEYELCLNDCCDTAMVHIQVEFDDCKETIPNVFTPNGDGKNDVFDPVRALEICDQIVEKPKLTVINRWGEILFRTDDYLPWDGSNGVGYSDVKMPAGTYFFRLNYETAGIERFANGEILLLRE